MKIIVNQTYSRTFKHKIKISTFKHIDYTKNMGYNIINYTRKNN